MRAIQRRQRELPPVTMKGPREKTCNWRKMKNLRYRDREGEKKNFDTERPPSIPSPDFDNRHVYS